MIEDAKLTDILAKAEKVLSSERLRLPGDTEEDFIYACDPRTIAAMVLELQALRQEVKRLNARIICEDCGEISDDHECKEILSKDDEPVEFAENPSPCSRSLCVDCGQEVHGR